MNLLLSSLALLGPSIATTPIESTPVSGQLRIFMAGAPSSRGMSVLLRGGSVGGGFQQELQQFGSLMNVLTALSGPEDYNDDDTSTLFRKLKSTDTTPSSAPPAFMSPTIIRFVAISLADDDSRTSSPCSMPCTSDVQFHCSKEATMENPFYVRMCLNGKIDTRRSARPDDFVAQGVSARCVTALAESPTVVESCYPDIKTHCANVQAGSSRVHSCLVKHTNAMTESCTKYFKTLDFRSEAQEVVKDAKPSFKSLLDRIATPSSSRWLQAKMEQASDYHHTVVEPRFVAARQWVVEHKQMVGVGSGILFVCILLAVNMIEQMRAEREEREEEELMLAAGYELLWDDEEPQI